MGFVGLEEVLFAASWARLAFVHTTLWALALGAVTLDLAVQGVHVISQALVYEVRLDAGSRLIGGYMVFYSAGSAAGSIEATTVYASAGWTGVCALGLGVSVAAVLAWASSAR